nr:LPS export ABC transporter permease LptF [Rhodovulum imhoffii]
MLSRLMVLFGFFALVLVSIYWVNRAVALFDSLIGGGQPALVFLEFTALTLPNVIRLVLPVAGFAATVFTINRLTADSELVVMQAMGFSPYRLARPVLAFGLVVALLTGILTHFLVPASRAQLELREDEIAHNVTASMLTEGRFLHPANGITFFIREITPTGELRDVFLSDARGTTRRITYTAQRALLVQEETGPKLLMFDGLVQALHLTNQRLATTSFSDLTYDVAALLSQPNTGRLDLRILPTPDLLSPTSERIEAARATRAEFLTEAHARTGQPLMAVAGVLIGFAALVVGGFSRFGLWRQILLAIGILVGLQLLDNSLTEIARHDETLWPLVYLPPMVGLLIGGMLMYLSARTIRWRRATRSASA